MNEESAKKTDVHGMYKVREGIVINKDNDALEAYKKRKMKNQKVDILEEQVQDIKNDLEEIKQLLRGLIK